MPTSGSAGTGLREKLKTFLDDDAGKATSCQNECEGPAEN